MKIKLAVSPEHHDAVALELTKLGIELDDKAELVLSEPSRFEDKLMVKDPDPKGRVLLPVHEIILIESCGHTVEVHTRDKTYHGTDRLYKILGTLDPEQFLRVSNSAVIARDKVRRITPTLSMKFILTLESNKQVDVTRSYYYIFKEAFGI